MLSSEKSKFEAILGLRVPYSHDDVKASFKRVAVQTHPDKGGSTESFRLAIEARDALLANPQSSAIRHPRAKAGTSVKMGRDVICKYNAMPSDLFFRRPVTVRYSRMVICKSCNGSGDTSGVVVKCSSCMGTGKEDMRYASMVKGSSNGICSECLGNGLHISNPCPECECGLVSQVTTAEVRGHPSGSVAVMGKGDECWTGSSGRLHVNFGVPQDAHERLTAEGLQVMLECTTAHFALNSNLSTGLPELPVAYFDNGSTLSVKNTKFGPVLLRRRVIPPDLSDPEILSHYRDLAKIE